jgi:hypothetical protein
MRAQNREDGAGARTMTPMSAKNVRAIVRTPFMMMLAPVLTPRGLLTLTAANTGR